MKCLPILAAVLLPLAPASAGLIENGDFADGATGWGNWSPTPERLQVAIEDGVARVTLSPGVPTSGCIVTNLTGIELTHHFAASATIDATALTAGHAVLRIEFWRADRGEPGARAESAPVPAGRKSNATVEFQPPEGTTLVKVTGYLVDAVGAVTFDDFKVLDRTGPAVRAIGPGVVTAGDDAAAGVQVVNGTAATIAGPLLLTVRDGERTVLEQRRDLNVAADGEETVVFALGKLPAGAYTVAWYAAGQTGERTVHVIEGPQPPFGRYGGWAAWSGTKTGFYHTEQLDGRWWLIDPEGHRFFSVGVNGVNEQGTGSPALGYSPYRRANRALYADDAAWAARAIARLRLWGFNTLGSWSSELAESTGHPYTHNLDIGRRATSRQMTQVREGRSPWSWFPDVFADDFVNGARRVATAECARRRDDKLLVGYFLDNEFSWDGLWEAAFTTDPHSACRDAFVETARKLFGTADKLRQVAGAGVDSFDDLRTLTQPLRANSQWRDAWLEAVSEQYYAVTTAAIRAADPNHLVISQRYAGHTPDPSAKAAGRHCDIVCMNFYNDGVAYGISTNLQQRFAELSELTGKPMMIGEWSFKAMDSGLPNTKGAATPVETQQDRAVGYASFIATAAANPYLVGAHWFIFSDQPLEGRGDGENSNYGLVDQTDRPYPEMAVTTSFMNRFAYRLAAAATFDSTPVVVRQTGPAWVTAAGDGFKVNPAGAEARFSVEDEVLGGRLLLGLPDGRAAATWREGDRTATVSAPADGARTSLYRRGETVLDGAGQEDLPASLRRPYVTIEPGTLPSKAARYPVTLLVHNPTAQAVTGPWDVRLSPGWLLDDLPPLNVAPQTTARVPAVLTAPAGSMTWPRLEVWAPFVDLVVWRAGDPVDLVAQPAGDGYELLVRRHDREAGEAKLALTSTPAGLRCEQTLAWQAGQQTLRVPLQGQASSASARLHGTYTVAGSKPVDVAVRLYDVGGALDTKPAFELPEGAAWLDGAIRLRRATPGTIDCAFPTLPLEPGHQTVVVSARVRWDNIVRGPGESWHRGNVAIYFTDAAGQYVAHRDLVLGHDSSDWQTCLQAARIPDGAVNVTVHARLLECTGDLWIDDVAVVDCPAELSREVAGPRVSFMSPGAS